MTKKPSDGSKQSNGATNQPANDSSTFYAYVGMGACFITPGVMAAVDGSDTTAAGSTNSSQSSTASDSRAKIGWNGAPYTTTYSGENKQGNHYCNRDYGPGAPNQNSYHYSNKDGSYYYNNPDHSKYYNNGDGYSFQKRTDGDTYHKYDDGAYGYTHPDGSRYYNNGDGDAWYQPGDRK